MPIPRVRRTSSFVAPPPALDNERRILICIFSRTGLKVIPNSQYRPRGDGLHDSHAEVIARRSLLRWFYSQLELAQAGKVSHLERGDFYDATGDVSGAGEGAERRWRLKEGLLLGMYISTLPCTSSISLRFNPMMAHRTCDDTGGDASMYHLSLQAPSTSAAPPTSLSTLSPTPSPALPSSDAPAPTPTSTMAENARLASTLGLTTTYERDAPSSTSQQVQRGRQSYTTSSLRTKPGRSDSPLATSHSCSDKISLWNYVGVQGGLLSSLLERVAIDVMVIGLTLKDEERERMTTEIRRGLGGRLKGVDATGETGETTVRQEYYLKIPEIHFSDVEFFHSKEVVLRRCGAMGNESEIVSGLSSELSTHVIAATSN